MTNPAPAMHVRASQNPHSLAYIDQAVDPAHIAAPPAIMIHGLAL